MKNTVSVRTYSDSGEANDLLSDAAPGEAIAKFFAAGTDAVVIRAITEEGKVVTLSFGQESISVSVRE